MLFPGAPLNYIPVDWNLLGIRQDNTEMQRGNDMGCRAAPQRTVYSHTGRLGFTWTSNTTIAVMQRQIFGLP